MDKLVGVPSLLAEFSLIHGRAVPRLYAENLIITDHEIKTASCTAVRAGGWNEFQTLYQTSSLNCIILFKVYRWFFANSRVRSCGL
jgi:hypothetical protein